MANFRYPSDATRYDIAFGFDSQFAPHVAAVIASLVRHAPGANFRFIILCTGIDHSLRSRIEIVAPGAEFLWIDVSDFVWPSIPNDGYTSRATLFRLGLEKLAPEDCRRVLYLDADVIALRDVRELWNADLGIYPIGAVIDTYLDPVAFATRWTLSPDSNYFNAGVLLIDLERVRAGRIFSGAIDFLVQHQRHLPYNDQDALNWAFWGRWQKLKTAWNVQRYMRFPEIDSELPEEKRLNGESPAVVHFIWKDKPWLPSVWHPWAWAYWENLAGTPFAPEVAQTYGVKFSHKLRLRLRWLFFRPNALPVLVHLEQIRARRVSSSQR
jgi:lipopolysaccharide biosynthesis glycosyltransferase